MKTVWLGPAAAVFAFPTPSHASYAVVLNVGQAAARGMSATIRPRECVGQLVGPNSSGVTLVGRLLLTSLLSVRMTTQVGSDRSRNPEYKVNVSVIYNGGQIQSMSVIHTLMNGQEVDRSEQYSNSRLSQRNNVATWVGYRGPLQMTGVFNPNNMTYVEYITRNGHLETKIDTRCHM
jgi:archaellum component FlaF (FlaF/FlaG flagellin family)